MKKVIVICGPTAVGKTKISIELAKTLNTEIISGDSVQVFRGLDIGSAKIKPDEKQGIVHHLIDIKDIDETYDVAQFQTAARKLIDELKTPLIVGGTGLYIKAVIDNYEFDSPAYNINDEKIYELESNEMIHDKLKIADMKTALKIHPNNRRRVIRALTQAKHGLRSQIQKKDERLYDALVIYLSMPREKLYERINLRVDQMLDEGLVEEAKAIYNQAKKLNILGYRELNQYFDGELTFDQAVDEIKKKTRHLAKRQETWFKHQMAATIIEVDPNNINVAIKKVIELANVFMGEQK